MTTVNWDIIVIKEIQNYPVLWDDKFTNQNIIERTWQNMASKLKIDVHWLKSHWSTLYEKFNNELIRRNENQHTDSNFKYFKEMIFLTKHKHKRIYIRNDETSIENTEKLISNTTEDNGCNEATEFTITEDDIDCDFESDNEIDLFQELSEDEVEVITVKTEISETEECEKLIKIERNFDESPQKKIPKLDHFDEKVFLLNNCSNDKSDNTIFGEYLAEMLNKMNTETRTIVKKEIINLLLKYMNKVE